MTHDPHAPVPARSATQEREQEDAPRGWTVGRTLALAVLLLSVGLLCLAAFRDLSTDWVASAVLVLVLVLAVAKVLDG